MATLFYSFHDGEVYTLHKHCDLKTLMNEQAGGDGVLIYATKDVFEIVEYRNGRETGYTTRFVNHGTSVHEQFDEMDEAVEELLTFLEKMINNAR